MKMLDLYYIDLKYIRNLTNADDNVMSISPQRGKEKRPFIGVIVLVNGAEYCIPLTSPKEKFKTRKSQLDFIKIFDESKRDESNQFKLIGVLNINNMIPVSSMVITNVDLSIHKNDSIEVVQSKILMQKQLKWCRKNLSVITNRAQKVYDLVVNKPQKNRNLVKRSSNFKRLEKELEKYIHNRKL